MEDLKFSALKKEVQQVIDFIGNKQYEDAQNKLAEASDLLDEILDHSDDDDDLIEISRFQVLLNQLQRKISGLDN